MMKGMNGDSEEPNALLIGRLFFAKGQAHGTITASNTVAGKSVPRLKTGRSPG